MNKVLEEISKIGILPVVVLEDAKDAKPLHTLYVLVVYLVLKLHLEQQLPKNRLPSCVKNFLKC